MSALSGYIFVSLLFAAFFAISFLSFLGDYEKTECEMTYMFEYPQFVRITNDADLLQPKYAVYAYSEGRLTERARNMDFDGIPVLYIPGSAGSHKQVRSLASIALRKALNSRLHYHLDYFTVDLNNELSALNGALLEEQTNYVNHTIDTILKLYSKNKFPVKSMVLVGHSMGGVIAKAIVAALPEGSELVPIVIALSAPLLRPVIELDYYFTQYYAKIDEKFALRKQTTFVSVAGGYEDFLVPAFLTQQGHLNLVATNVPKSWVSADHQSVVWCKQLVLAINRALFESVNPSTQQISMNHEYRLDVFNHHLVKHNGLRLREQYDFTISISSQGEWFESIYRQYSIRLHKGAQDIKWYMIPILLQPQNEAITVVALNMKSQEWVYACPAVNVKAASRVCEVGKHLTQLTEISPSKKYKRRTLRMNLFELKRGYPTATHVALRVTPTDEPVIFHIDVHSPNARTITYAEPSFWLRFHKDVIIEKSDEKAIEYTVLLPHLNQVIQAYTIYLEPLECTSHIHHATVSLKVPWDHHDLHGFVTDDLRDPITFRLYNSVPYGLHNDTAEILLTLDPTCRYKLSIKNGIHFGNMARFYSPMLIANMATIILMSLRSQLLRIGKTNRCSNFFTAINEGAKPYYVVLAIKILSKLSSLPFLAHLVRKSDWQRLNEGNFEFTLMPIFMYMASVGIVWLLALSMAVSFIFFESTVHKFLFKFMSRTFKGTAAWADHLTNAFEKIPGVVAVVLIIVSFSTSGGLAICLATGFYFLKLTQMSQDFIEDLVKGMAKSIGRRLKDTLLTRLKERWRKFRSENDSIDNAIEKLPANKVPESKDNNTIKKCEEFIENSIESTSKDKVEGIDDKVNLEKPLEFVIESGEGSMRVTGSKLVEILSQNETRSTEDGVENENTLLTNEELQENENETKAEFIKLPKIDVCWIQEILENNEIFFHFTIFLLYFLVACLNIPSVLTWAHNYKYSKRLEPDPAFIPGLVLSICALPLWQFDFPRVDRKHYNLLSHIVNGCGILCIIYSMISIYLLSFIISGAVVAVTLHQLLSGQKAAVAEAGENDDDDLSYRKRVKDKWE